jgi:peptidoglycan hydrolase-like protein with peptidoglycan-binding domain
VKTAQVLLRALGYQPSLLGSLDSRTQDAIHAFQRAEGIEQTDAVTVSRSSAGASVGEQLE